MPSPLGAVIFDLDGTLVDSNPLQLRAWLAAMKEHGYEVGRDRVEREIGKGGDQLVESILGSNIDRKDGERLRRSQASASRALIETEGVSLLMKSNSLIEACRSKGLKIALATSGSREIGDALLSAAGLDRKWFDVIVTSDDVEATKPQADLYHLTVQRLKLSPAECVNVGDTPYDCIAGRRAGLVTIGLHGGLNDAKTLRQSGARETVANPATLLIDLEALLWKAAPRSLRLTDQAVEQLVRAALDQASLAMENGEAPIGSVIADNDGQIIGRGYNRLNSTGDRINHAEIVALHEAASARKRNCSGWIVVSTIEPCVMCFGATMEAGIDTVLYALEAPSDGGAERVTPPVSPECCMPRIVGGILADRSRELFRKWLATNPPEDQAAFGRQLLAKT